MFDLSRTLIITKYIFCPTKQNGVSAFLQFFIFENVCAVVQMLLHVEQIF